MHLETALILGGNNGLLGQSLAHILKREGWAVLTPDRTELDFFEPDQVQNYIQNYQVDIVLNGIGYTRVDTAEEEQDQAFRLNRDLPKILGAVCRKEDIYLLHYSTDYVFDGKKTTPYSTEDTPQPKSVYGQSKLKGEQALWDIAWDKLLIVRTSWLFGPFKTNFVHRVLQLAQEKKHLNVIHDQVGSPTYTMDLAKHSLELIKKQTRGLFHITNKGEASWCELASESIRCAGLHCQVNPISTQEYPQKAKRPQYSVLDSSKFCMVSGKSIRPWVQALRDYIFSYQEPC